MNELLLHSLERITAEEQRLLDGAADIERELYMAEGGDVIHSKKLLRHGKQIAVRAHTRFIRFPEHTHDYVEMVYMCKGATTHRINGETVVLRQGELLFLNQSARQEVLPAGREDVAVNLIILPAFFDSVLQMLGDEKTPLHRFLVDCLQNRGTACYLHFRVADVLPVQNLAENLIWTLMHDVPNKRNMNQITMGLLMLQLANYTDRLAYQNTEDGLLVHTLRYIEERYATASLSELAEQLHYDFHWLSRAVREQSGKTFTELVQEKRLSQASFLLRHTDIRVAEVARLVGYENTSYFHRLFYDRYHVSPRQYRVGETT